MSFMDIKVKPFNVQINVPSSKSYANRALILAAINPQSVKINNPPMSSDFDNILSAFSQIGIKIKRDESSVTIINSFPACENDTSATEFKLTTGDGGTTNRFLLPLLARGSKTYHLWALGHMKTRPMQDLISVLNDLNAKIYGPYNNAGPWISVKGPIQLSASQHTVNCQHTTQFLTGLLLATADNPQVKYQAINLASSIKYLEMTNMMVRNYNQPTWNVPVDFSSLSYPLALASIIGEAKILNCQQIDPYQADAEFINILKKAGSNITLSVDGLSLSHHAKLNPIVSDCSGHPDLVAALAFVCAYIPGQSKLSNIEVLKHKECDRIQAICDILEKFQIKHFYDEIQDVLTIDGKKAGTTAAVQYTPPIDHRMIMLSYLFMRAESGGQLANSQYVSKSFGNFFEIM